MEKPPSKLRPVLRWEEPGLTISAGRGWVTFGDYPGKNLRLRKHLPAFSDALAATASTMDGRCREIKDGTQTVASLTYNDSLTACELRFYDNRRSFVFGRPVMTDLACWLAGGKSAGRVSRSGDRVTIRLGASVLTLSIGKGAVVRDLLLAAAAGEDVAPTPVGKKHPLLRLYPLEDETFGCNFGSNYWGQTITRAGLVFLAEEIDAALCARGDE